MGLFFNNTEIKGLHFGDREIEDIWFGTTNVYAVWAVYEGALPATFNANGSDMRQYQIYGADGGVGDKTNNLFNYSAKDTSNGYVEKSILKASGAVESSSSWQISEYIDCEELTNYVWKWTDVENPQQLYASICFYGNAHNFIVGEAYNRKNIISVTSPRNARYIRVSYLNSEGATLRNCILALGTTAPAYYIPYGYEVDIGVSDGTNTETTPIYIGDTALQKDEYVDYKEGKVYRKVNNVLTPTDPPVALPALPTCEGTTIVDYAGQSQAVPEKVLLEYRKEGF